jgi:hypothetical protein
LLVGCEAGGDLGREGMHRSIYVPKVSRRSEDDHGITVYRPSAAVKSARERSTLASDDSQTRQGSGGKERPSVADEESAASAQAPAELRSDGHRRVYSEPLESLSAACGNRAEVCRV